MVSEAPNHSDTRRDGHTVSYADDLLDQSAADNTRHQIKELMFLLVDLADYTLEDLNAIADEVFESLR